MKEILKVINIKNIDEVTLRRLIRIKQIFIHGENHRKNITDFDNILATHHFDWANEMLLKLIASKYSIKNIDNKFLSQLWTEINEEYLNEFNTNLPLRNEILKKVRKDRNAAQHSGTAISDSDTFDNESYTRTFLQHVIKEVYDMNLSELRLSSLIHDPQTKKLINRAEVQINQQEYKSAIALLYNVFRKEFHNVKSQISERDLIEALDFPSKQYEDENLEELFGDVVDLLLSEVMLRELNLKLYDYGRLSRLGRTARMADLRPLFSKSSSTKSYYSKDEVDFCYNLVLEFLLKWQKVP